MIQYIVFMADVQAAQIGKLREAITNAMNAGNDIHLIMSSPGGNVAEGLNMAAFMKSLPVKITTHNFLQTDSIANVIFASGSVRYASPNSSFMFHGVTFHYEKQDLTENQIGEQHTGIRMLREKIAAAFAAYTGMTTTEVNSLMVSGTTTLAPQEALSKGIIHEIRDAAVPPGSQVVSIGNI